MSLEIYFTCIYVQHQIVWIMLFFPSNLNVLFFNNSQLHIKMGVNSKHVQSNATLHTCTCYWHLSQDFKSDIITWEPEGRYCCTKSMAIMPFWLSTDKLCTILLLLQIGISWEPGRCYCYTVQNHKGTIVIYTHTKSMVLVSALLVLNGSMALTTFWFSSSQVNWWYILNSLELNRYT